MQTYLDDEFVEDDRIALTGAGCLTLSLLDLAQRTLCLLTAPIMDADERARLVADLTTALDDDGPQTLTRRGF